MLTQLLAAEASMDYEGLEYLPHPPSLQRHSKGSRPRVGLACMTPAVNTRGTTFLRRANHTGLRYVPGRKLSVQLLAVNWARKIDRSTYRAELFIRGVFWWCMLLCKYIRYDAVCTKRWNIPICTTNGDADDAHHSDVVQQDTESRRHRTRVMVLKWGSAEALKP